MTLEYPGNSSRVIVCGPGSAVTEPASVDNGSEPGTPAGSAAGLKNAPPPSTEMPNCDAQALEPSAD
jgi:hypothetical protein